MIQLPDTEPDTGPSQFVQQTKTTGLHRVVGQAIKSLRAERQWRQVDLAKHTGGVLTRATIANIEAGNRRVDLDELVPLCRALEVTLAELIERGGKVILYDTPEDQPNKIVKSEKVMSTLFGTVGESATYTELVDNTSATAREVAREESRAVAREVVDERLRALLDTIREAVDR